MLKFALGLIVGLALAVCGYRPYQIESEYLRNIKSGLHTEPTHCTLETVRTKGLVI